MAYERERNGDVHDPMCAATESLYNNDFKTSFGWIEMSHTAAELTLDPTETHLLFLL